MDILIPKPCLTNRHFDLRLSHQDYRQISLRAVRGGPAGKEDRQHLGQLHYRVIIVLCTIFYIYLRYVFPNQPL